MNPSITPLISRLNALSAERLRGMRRGIEKESLRSLPDGRLAMTPHPTALGSPLHHPFITTDFSESQVELVTGPHASPDDCLTELTQLHQVTARALGDERLWVSSMPCQLPEEADIPLGQYGSSNIAKAKTVYRRGLGHRYGRRMQTISGIHYNWSLPGLSSADYFALIRNFRRHSFLLLLLFGASPAVSSCFVEGLPHHLYPLGPHTLGMHQGTSLRMGRLGYQSDAQATLAVSYNDLEGYGASLEAALTTQYPAYEAVGLKDANGDYQQLSTSLLQIENEFYGTIRPKRPIRPGERPLHALRERGVEYVEVRCMDLDPFEDVGISASTARFLDVFLLHCLLSDSPPDTPEEIAALGRNQHRTAERGRVPGLTLERADGEVNILEWAHELVAQMQPIAEHLDSVHGGRNHAAAITAAQAGLDDTDSLPSARVLQAMDAQHQGSYMRFIRARSAQVRDTLLAKPLSEQAARHWAGVAADSLAKQASLEAEETASFEDFLRDYIAPQCLVV